MTGKRYYTLVTGGKGEEEKKRERSGFEFYCSWIYPGGLEGTGWLWDHAHSLGHGAILLFSFLFLTFFM